MFSVYKGRADNVWKDVVSLEGPEITTISLSNYDTKTSNKGETG